MLKQALERLELAINRVIFLNANQEVILKRLSGRRVCEECGETYHIINIPPKKAGECDKCGGKLVQRDDDKEETILQRLKVYQEQTAEVLEYYRGEGILLEVDGSLPIDETYPIIRAGLK